MNILPPLDSSEALVELHGTLQLRLRPEDVAERIVVGLSSVLPKEALRLLPVPGSLLIACADGCGEQYRAPSYSLMATTYVGPVGYDSAVATLIHCLPELGLRPDEVDAQNLSAIHALLAMAATYLGTTPERHSFRHDRLSAQARKDHGLEISRRHYDRAFRAFSHLAEKAELLEREITKARTIAFSKSLLATQITLEDFSSDPATAAFIAYYTARRNLRTEFTNEAQVKPMDKAAEALLKAVEDSPTANWYAIAHVYTTRRVLKHLTEAQAGELLGIYWNQLNSIGTLLDRAWVDRKRDRSVMVVRKGDDSSTWNMASRAWNMARTGWLNLLGGLGHLEVLDTTCPGKVQTLIAADVAYWHSETNGGLHGDTAVWAELPLPWEVVSGKASCTRADVEAACGLHKVDPETEGWTLPRSTGVVEEVKATPELVHGISVASPELAEILRRAGAFSGRGTPTTKMLDLTLDPKDDSE